MATRLFVFITVLPAIIGAQSSPESQCETFLTNCLNSTIASYQAALIQYDFITVCSDLSKTRSCYNAAARKDVCATVVSDIAPLNETNTASLSQFCPEGSPDPCLLSTKDCVTKFRDDMSTSSGDTKAICTASTTARQCMQAVQCEGRQDNLQQKLEQEFSQAATTASCKQYDPNASPCEKDANQCLLPVEARLKQDQNSYNFEDLCGAWPQAEACFSRLLSDSNCSSVHDKMQAQIHNLTGVYHQYCGDDDKPLPCLEELEQCTVNYTTLNQLPDLTSHPIVYCRAIENLIGCVKDLKTDLASCPSLGSVNSLAGFQHDQAELNQACSKLLTPCTGQTPDCLLTQTLKLKQALDSAQWDQVCQAAGEYQKCLNYYRAMPQCQIDDVMQLEATYITNITTIYCQSKSSNGSAALPCLQEIQTCKNDFIQNRSTRGMCSKEAMLTQCLSQIVCPSNHGLEQELVKARQAAQILVADCRPPAVTTEKVADTHGGSSTPGFSPLLLAAPILSLLPSYQHVQ